MMSYLSYVMILGLLAAGCAAPTQPSGLSDSGVSNSAKKSSDNVASAANIDYGGALVGDANMQATVKKCLDTGKFYDRKLQKCSDFSLAQISCRRESVKTVMNSDTRKQFDNLFSNQLAGFQLDQCLNCSSPIGNSLCEGTAAQKESRPGMRLYLVKEDPGSTSLSMKSVYIIK
jgi:hypothetical protein